MDGVLPLWKPKGMTSHDCVMKIRRLYNTRKVGHTGTLDPEVEGVLGICIGQATKIVPYLTSIKKTYLAECSLGISTDTEDAHGKIIEEKEVINLPTNQQIENTLNKFKGKIIQIPPMYSAVKVNGKKLYEYARANQTVERPKREVTIHELIHINPSEGPKSTFDLRVVCSAGTYIRTLCVDIGKDLGYPAHMSNLSRIEASSFKIEETVTFKDIEKAKEENKHEKLLVPLLKPLNFMERINVSNETKFKVLNGQKLDRPKQITYLDPFLVVKDNQLLAIYHVHPENQEIIKPIRVFN